MQGMGLGAQRLSASQRWACLISEATWQAEKECSTPFGITEVGIVRHRVGSHKRIRAQRLSASQRWAFELAQAPRSWRECSTPFGITEVGISTSTAWSAAARMCSTPFGITEVGIRRPPGPSLPRYGCAQRLSASQRWALISPESPETCLECSTPFGITEVGI